MARPIALVTLLALCRTPIPTLQAQLSTPSATTIDSIVGHEMKLRRIPGVAVAVIDNGSVVFKRVYGTANLETGTPLQVSAVFELASVTKQFTGAAIMLLVEDGKVGLDEPISRYIDNAPAEWARITVRHLLTHTGGLDSPAVPRYEGSALLNITTKQAFDFVAKLPLRFPPGREGWYSDPGYLLLGMIVEKASGQSYRQFMQQRIFNRLQMTHSSILDKARVLPGRVSTYMIRDGQLLNWRRDWDHELPSFFGIFSTLDDLAKWDAALRAETLLKSASLQQMWMPAQLENGQLARVTDRYYGFGFELADLRGRRTVGHGGASGTYVLRFLDEPLTIIVLSNLETMSGARHPVLLARSVAGAVRPSYRPPNLLAAQRDPNPQLARDVHTLLTDLAANQESAVMSVAYRSWYSTAFGFRAFWGRQIRGFGPLAYLGEDNVKGRPLWDAEPLDRLLHYRTEVNGRAIFVTIGLNGEGKIARLEFLAYQ
jgi:CubicO group peptidase (beta-lactamase class C family)